MVLCECGGKLEIIEENGKKSNILCHECGKEFKRKFYDNRLFEVQKGNIWIAPLIADLWRMFKRKGIKRAIKFAPKKDYWFHWWTPTWHFGKGPYITIGFWKIRIYRGY